MIAGGTVLALIPARGGSKGVPRKNVRPLGGKPVLQWTVEAATASRYLDRLVLSTDDDEIAALGQQLGVEVPFRRPGSAATDEAGADAVIEHALATIGESFEYLVYLQPTSPFRATSDIDGCLELLAATSADSCVSVAESEVRPAWLFYVSPDSRLTPVLGTTPVSQRQDLETAYELNGAVYAARLARYLKTRTFFMSETLAWVMPPDRSIDLDEPRDFDLAEAALRQRGRIPV